MDSQTEFDQEEQRYRAEVKTYLEIRDEEDRLEELFLTALSILATENLCWASNRLAFYRWSRGRRITYIYYTQDQAALGLPMAQQLMAKVLALRMTQ